MGLRSDAGLESRLFGGGGRLSSGGLAKVALQHVGTDGIGRRYVTVIVATVAQRITYEQTEGCWRFEDKREMVRALQQETRIGGARR